MLATEIKKARQLLNEKESILVISHRSPDSDTLGAGIALNILLSRFDRSVTLACVDKPSKSFSFLPHIDKYVKEFDISEYDLVVIVDAGASYMTDFHLKYPDMYETDVPIINIDHHASNDLFGTVNIVDPLSASVTLMLYRMFIEWGVDIDKDMATCLLAGMYGDTGSFMHSNTSKEVLDAAADLMERGASVAEISKSLFKNTSVDSLRLWGKVLENAYITPDGVTMSVVNDSDYDDSNAGPDNLSGVIDYLNMVPDTRFAVLVNEDRHGNVKGSFRTRNEDVDVSRIAAVFGGGGHPKASGFSVPGKLQQDVRYSIVSDANNKSLEF
ncbi:bifunctional oligoribonuclease/PAP phosphatase NrnA [Candidatus Peregrinibacteria bacterium]|jgi:bifunctional oligoribonuclease and PAP phosphatase NrnA|nr:bifunctional oligoribonuclease/PAP phosphatase NrnA [Candidatus Peregrinibacteria bacterium]MBT7736537.1 bifunctional oligoribonuclease/PAP phosphatase NrnA [Candidatus Peregrinibacteria bacterium]